MSIQENCCADSGRNASIRPSAVACQVTALTLSFGKTTQYAMMVQTPALTANVLDQYAQYGMLIAVYVHWKNSCVMSVAIGMVSVCRLLIVMNLMKK